MLWLFLYSICVTRYCTMSILLSFRHPLSFQAANSELKCGRYVENYTHLTK